MAVVSGTVAGDEEEKSLRDELTLPILLIDRIRNAAAEAESSKSECFEIVNQCESLSRMLGAVVHLTSAAPPQSFYDRPVRGIVTEVSRNLDRTLTLIRRCRYAGFFFQVFSIVTSADFKKVSGLLESSIGDMKWLLEIFDCEGNSLTLPPFASSNDPTLAMVWSSIASLMTGKQLRDRIDSVTYLTSLADSSDRNKKMIVEEGAIPPLLKLLKDGGGVGSTEAQIAAANALSSLVDGVERTRAVAAKLGIPVIVQALSSSPMKVQIAVAGLVAKMANVDEKARDDFGKENVMKPIVSCLMMDLVLDDHRQIDGGKASIHSIVQINKELAKNTLSDHTYHNVQSSSSSSSSDGSNKERENVRPEIKHKLKVKCSLALWRLCKGSLLNSRKIAEGKGLQCVSKIIESEKEELQFYCLITVMEIAEVAESNSEFRKIAWKPSYPRVKNMLDQLLRVIKEENDPKFQIPAVKAIGSFARIFSAKETRVIGPIVTQLGSKSVELAIEAAIALGKFVCTENHNRVEHSKAIIEFNGVSLVIKMSKANDRAKMHGLILLCYLSLNVGNSKALEEARALEYLESSAARSFVASNHGLRDLHIKAVHHLKVYQVRGLGTHPHSHNYYMV